MSKEKVDYIIKQIKKYDTATSFLDDEYKESKQGFLYEKLWDICLKFNIVNRFENNLLHLFSENINNIKPNKIDTDLQNINDMFDVYIKSKWISGNTGGYSDITFKYQDENKDDIYVVSSVKYYGHEKDISKYDIQNLCTVIKNQFQDKKYKVLLFIKNKEDFMKKVKAANKSTNIILKYIDLDNDIYDLNDLEKYYAVLRKLLSDYEYLKNDEYYEKFKTEYLKIKNNLIFKPKFHQKLFIDKILYDIKKNDENKDFLIGAIPRTGKTYIMAGLILDYIKSLKDATIYNFLIITPAPTETISQYQEVFESYYDFKLHKINFIIINDKYEKIKKQIKENNHNVFVVSIQRLNGKKDKVEPDELDEEDKKDAKKSSSSSDKKTSSSSSSSSSGKKSSSSDKKTSSSSSSSSSSGEKSSSSGKNFIESTKLKTKITKKLCEIWEENKKINPLKPKNPITDYSISNTSPIYKELDKVCSILLKKGGGISKENEVKLEKIIKNHFDKIKFHMLFLDEAHYCLSSNKSEFIIDTIKSKYSTEKFKRIFITASFNKPIERYMIHNKLFWDLNDINTLRKINNKFNHNKKGAYHDFKEYCDNNDVFKEIIANTLKKDFSIDITKTNLDKNDNIHFKLLINDYKYYPEPFLLTTVWNNLDKIYKEKALAHGLSADFTMNLLFKVQKDKFKNEEQLKELFYYYLGVPRKHFTSNEGDNIDLTYIEQNYYKKNGIIKRIENICYNNCRTLQYKKVTSQLWFLPKGDISNVCMCLIDFLKRYFKTFYEETKFIICLSAIAKKDKDKKAELEKIGVEFIIGTSNKEGGVKKEISDIEKNIDSKYKNIVILTNGRLQLGISLNNVDIVTLFNNDQQSDRLYQMMFRSLTEVADDNVCDINKYCSNKKYGFIVDLNPQRTIFFMDYMVKTLKRDKKKDQESDIPKIEEQKELVELFNIDKDYFTGDYDNEDELKKYTKELFDKMATDYNIKYDYIKYLLKEKNIIDDDFIDKNKDILSLFKINDKNKKVLIEKRGVDDLKTTPKKQEKNDIENDKKESKDEVDYDKLKTRTIELLSHIINISLILLMCDKNDKCYLSQDYSDEDKLFEDFKNNIDIIKSNENLTDLFIHSLNNNLYDDKNHFTKDNIFTLITELFKKF